MTLKPRFDERPLATQIRAHVGIASKVPIHSADYAQHLFKVDFDQVSQSRFEQIFEALFSTATPLPTWPPWRETPPAVDAVIELDRSDLQMTLGNDIGNPESVIVDYRVCLYTPESIPINCWESSAAQLHQRVPMERFDMAAYLERLIDTASREAMARFMLAFEGDPLVKEWASRLASP